MGSSSRKKVIFSAMMFFIVFLLINIYLDFRSKAFEVYIDNAVVGYTSNKKDAKVNYLNVIQDLNSNLKEEEKIQKKRISFKRINEDIKLSTYDEMKHNILKTMNEEKTLKSLNINNKKLGYVLNEKEVKNILTKVGEYYAKENNIDKDNISSINIKGKIELKEEKAKISDLSTSEYLFNKIVSNNKSLLDIDLIVNDKQIVDIEPIVKIERTDELELGESEVKIEGKKGKKEQSISVTYRNGKKISSVVLSENIIKDSEDKIVVKGTKKTVNSNLSSLSNPTRGGYITSSFGERWGKMHKGIDISGNIGDPVMASFNGVVKSAFYERDGYGNIIILEHDNGLETRYAHMNGFAVKEGDVVKKGDIIGSVGNTGRSTGPHLHFELRVNGSPVDPEGYIY